MIPLLAELGILGVLLAFFTAIVRYVEYRAKKKTHEEAFQSSKAFFHDTVLTPLVSLLVLLVILGFLIGPYELWERDEQRIASDKSQIEMIPSLRDEFKSKQTKIEEFGAQLNDQARFSSAIKDVIKDHDVEKLEGVAAEQNRELGLARRALAYCEVAYFVRSTNPVDGTSSLMDSGFFPRDAAGSILLSNGDYGLLHWRIITNKDGSAHIETQFDKRGNWGTH